MAFRRQINYSSNTSVQGCIYHRDYLNRHTHRFLCPMAVIGHENGTETYIQTVPCKSVTRYRNIVHVLRLCTMQKCNALQKDCTCTSFVYHAKV